MDSVIKKLKNTKSIKNVALVTAVIIIATVVFIWWSQNNQPGKLDSFAKCIKDSGAKFYGAFWCAHCQNQKKLFGSSKKYLPYMECSTLDGNSQLEFCKNEKIISYPTWEFKDGSRQEGELTLRELSKKSGCPLPK